jgi:DNA polymerase I-like protein with 3'-5' exonuclease and polymerase domains
VSNWTAPTELPDLRRVGVIALDTETNDERLRADMGSGWPFKGGYICGVSLAWREGSDIRARYIPMRHPDSDNIDPAQVFQWLRDLRASDGVRSIVTQNGLYDWGWLRAEADIRMPPAERLEELGALATLIDENRKRYSLDELCKWRGVAGKNEASLAEGGAAIGLSKRDKPRANIWRMPARFVTSYAEQDVISTLALFESLNPVLDREGTRNAYRLEVDLLPMVLEMRRRGVRVDTTAAEQRRDQLLRKRDAIFTELSNKLGANIGMAEIGRNKWLAETFDRHGIKYPRTEKGNPSFKSEWMLRHPHWLPQLVAKADKYNKAAVDFLETHILGHVVKGRIHAEIHPHRSDEGGTRSLRFSYSDPPLQQMAARDEEIAPLIRGVFLPEHGEVWAKPDISQQEFRFITHYAAKLKLTRAEEAAARYRAEPTTDFHDFVAELTGLDRKQAKSVNFAKAFGAGVRKFAAMIGKPESEARAIYARYDHTLPFVHQLSKRCEHTAASRGYLELYDGARRHWDDWVAWVNWKGTAPCSREEAERRINDPEHAWYRKGPPHRIDTHKAMNALIQGSAARHTKLWMRACWREGITPLLQMHDCLDLSVASPEQAERVAQLGREAVALEVPVEVDLKFGRSWGDAIHTWDELCNGVKIHEALFAGQVGSGTPEIMHPRPSYEVEPETKHCAAVENSGNSKNLHERISRASAGNKIICPFHDDHDPSLQLYSDGHYHCFVCGAHGDIDELPEAPPTPAPNAPQNNTDTLERGIRLWQAANSVHGTLAERYLTETRKLDLAVLADIDAVLRFHPRCPFDGNSHRCVIALFRDVETDEIAGIHRIALTAKAEKIGRMMLGSWPRPRAIKLRSGNDQLIAGEGIETVIAGAMRRVDKSSTLWAMGSAGAIGKLPLISGFAGLTILVDREASNTGLDNARACAECWRLANRKAVLAIPHQAKADFNDLIKGKAP